MAVQENQAEFSAETARNLRNTVRKAKSKYWADKLDSVTDTNNVFKMTKWHQSTGRYHSPPLTDLQNPMGTPAISTSEKRDLLIRELLTNTADAGNISFDAPAIAARDIPFPVTMAQDICKAILGAGNTAPGI